MPSACPDGGVPCSDGLCVPRERVCDGHRHCPDGEDEAACSCVQVRLLLLLLPLMLLGFLVRG